jgi:hypothetical protein
MVPVKSAFASRIVQTIVRAAIGLWQSDGKQRKLHAAMSLPDFPEAT